MGRESEKMHAGNIYMPLAPTYFQVHSPLLLHHLMRMRMLRVAVNENITTQRMSPGIVPAHSTSPFVASFNKHVQGPEC